MINLHSHQTHGVRSFDANKDQIQNDFFFTIGLHPWWIKNNDISKLVELVKFNQENKKFLCVGEVGLDRVQGADFELQKEVFKNVLNSFPETTLIIHCVKSFSDILEMTKDFKGTLIFHDFNGNKEEIETIHKRGHYYSLGNNLFNNSKLSQNIEHIKMDHLFLETDDTDREIREVYFKLTQLLRCDIQDIIEAVHSNFKKVFNRDFYEL